MIGTHQQQQVLFTRADLEAISERFAAYLIQRQMTLDSAWKQAIEDQAQLIESKIELMDEGALVWDWPSVQLAAMRRELADNAELQKAVGT